MFADSAPKVSKKVTLFVTTLSSFLTTFSGSSINVALPSIGRELSMNVLTLSWIATGYLLTAAMFLVPFGKIADIIGRKKIYTWGIIVNAITLFLSVIAPSGWFLLMVRALQGIGAAMIFGTAIAILSSVFPAKERGRVLGINVSATYLGLSLGPFVGGLITQHFGWRYIFAVSTAIAVSILPFIFYKLKVEWAEARGEKFDYKGSLAYALALVCVMYGFTSLPGITGFVLIAAGILGILLFIYHENHCTYPVLSLGLFKGNTVFVFSNLAAFINYTATFAVAFLLSLYLQYIKGFSPQEAGFIMVAQPVVMAAFSPLAGRLSDKFEPQYIASLGMGLTAVGLLMFAFLSRETTVLFLIITLLIIGLGFALFSSPNTNAVMSAVERKDYSLASSILGTMRLTGQAISMGITTLVFALHLGNMKISTENLGLFLYSIRFAFVIFTIFCVAGVFASLARGKLR
ncbi:MAG: MFS transporter [Lentimicrobiaceae bacterium]|nr:MFS transporter [Lentimicrobiaceae bacterium]